jgi:hypothetical protein
MVHACTILRTHSMLQTTVLLVVALTSPISGCRSVCIVLSQTKTTELLLLLHVVESVLSLNQELF